MQNLQLADPKSCDSRLVVSSLPKLLSRDDVSQESVTSRPVLVKICLYTQHGMGREPVARVDPMLLRHVAASQTFDTEKGPDQKYTHSRMHFHKPNTPVCPLPSSLPPKREVIPRPPCSQLLTAKIVLFHFCAFYRDGFIPYELFCI